MSISRPFLIASSLCSTFIHTRRNIVHPPTRDPEKPMGGPEFGRLIGGCVMGRNDREESTTTLGNIDILQFSFVCAQCTWCSIQALLFSCHFSQAESTIVLCCILCSCEFCFQRHARELLHRWLNLQLLL